MSNLIPVDQIKIHNRIRKDYGDIDALATSISELGLLEPIIVTTDYVLIAGERRLLAVKRLEWKEIKAEITTAVDREQQLLMEIAENEKRKEFTPSERVAYGLELEQIEKIKAKERQGERTDLTSPSVDVEVKKRYGTDPIVSAKVGLSESSYRRAKRVIESGDRELIGKMDKGEIGIETAYKKVKAQNESKPTVESKPEQKPVVPAIPIQPEQKTDKLIDLAYLFSDSYQPEESEEDKAINEMFKKADDTINLMEQLKIAISVPIVSDFVLKSIKQKLTEYPDTVENADNLDRKAFVNIFNLLKRIIREG